MGSVKKTVVLLKRQLIKSFWKKNCIAGTLLGVIVVLKNSVCYSQFAGEHTVNVFEAFISNFARQGNALTIVIGAILIFADAPFLDTGSFLLLHRIGRKKWYMANWLYITSRSLIYYLELLVVSIIPFMIKGYPENKWSQTMLRIMKGYTRQMDRYGIFPPNMTLEKVPPLQSFCFTLLLCLLYTVFLVSIMFVLNMLVRRRAYGTIIAAAVHVVAVLMDAQGVLLPPVLERFSFFRNAIFPVGYDPQVSSVEFSFSLFLFWIYLLFIVGDHLLPYTEFILESAESDE